ncbi:MAG: cytochrome c oxidase subunit 3 [Planctomycetia bacterium]|nr:MAG: cytochrome c oxidase subunit 3 [Planctomycetia bacterium]
MMFAALVPTDPGGGSDGDSESRRRGSIGALGMVLLLASLSVLFASGIALFIVVRLADGDAWDPLPLPKSIWIATGVLLASSTTGMAAAFGAKRGPSAVLIGGLLLTALLGCVFLALQWQNWQELYPHFQKAEERAMERARALAVEMNLEPPLRAIPRAFGIFYMLTALHAAHVIAGVVPLLWVTVRAMLGAYRGTTGDGVRRVIVYWHFLDVMWLILLGLLAISAT